MKPTNNKNKNLQTINVTQQQLYSGPLPHPDILKGFKEINPDYPDRILKMAENHADCEIRNQDKIYSANSISLILGQVLTFLLGISGIVSGVVLALKGLSAPAITAIISGFAPIVISAIQNIKK